MESKMVYTVPEVAEILGVNREKVDRLRRLGMIPFMKLGRYKCRAAAIERFLLEVEGLDVDALIEEKEKSNDE